MDEFGTELDGNGQPGHVERPNATAEPLARFEDKGRPSRAREFRGRRQPGGASAENHYVV